MGAHELTPPEQFAVLAQRLRDGKSADEIQQIVVESAVQLIDGCDRAAIGVLDGERFRSAAATDDVMRLIDELQNEVGEGPCLEASVDNVVQVDNDIATGSKWPRLAAIVVERTPVRAMLAVPLVDEGRRSGALNIFADRIDAFDGEAVDNAAILAAFASVALSGAGHAARAEQLEVGMATNREIGAAVGILMATHNITQDQAFELLSNASQRLNRKLRDIASGIVRGEQSAGS
jgi:AmiR/NasT family two-component response regulator